jgi:hypothetical protein
VAEAMIKVRFSSIRFLSSNNPISAIFKKRAFQSVGAAMILDIGLQETPFLLNWALRYLGV